MSAGTPGGFIGACPGPHVSLSLGPSTLGGHASIRGDPAVPPGALGKRAGPNPSRAAGTEFQLTVDDLKAIVARLRSEGARFRGEIVEGKGVARSSSRIPLATPSSSSNPALRDRRLEEHAAAGRAETGDLQHARRCLPRAPPARPCINTRDNLSPAL